MKLLFMLVVLATGALPLFAQQSTDLKKEKEVEAQYAVVYTECSGFGGYCIYFEDGTTEDYLKTHHIKKPAEGEVDQNAAVLLGFLKYMRSLGFVLVSSEYITNPNKLVRTTQYIFLKTKT